MKKVFALLLTLAMVFAMTAIAEEPATEAAVEIEYVEIPLDADIKLNGNFSAKLVLNYGDSEKIDSGLMFYTNEGYQYGFKVRRESANRVDFYGVKDVDGSWKGFLIAEEYQEWLKDCYVSVDDGWDATEDRNITLIITVTDGIATVTAKGDVTGKEGTVHFDLSKSAWKDYEESESEPLVLTEGGMALGLGGGQVVQLFIDADTYAANQN